MNWITPLLLYAASLSNALEKLKENPYGFEFVDVGIAEQEIDIQRDRIYHLFGELDPIADFFREIGMNSEDVALSLAHRLKEIAMAVVEASGKETAWIALRAFTPTDQFDIPRWHADGFFHPPEEEDLEFKFIMTLAGPSTLFYLLTPADRKQISKHIHNRLHMKNYCKREKIVSPQRGTGAIFLAGPINTNAGLHSEPPIHENRLIFTVVPCMEKQLDRVKARVLSTYAKDSRS